MSSISGDIPSYIGAYRIDERIAEGGFGVVYRGFDPRLKREVAIKVLHPQHSSEPGRVSRFLREAQSAARLNYPGIVQIYDIVEENQRLALVMEYVHGKNLDRFIRDNPSLSLVERIDIGVQIAEALYLAHQAEIVHRDVKPANILVDENGVVKLTDFNLARLRDTSLTPLTGEHNVLGTPAYMSPEQCLGKEASPQSDIYSLGVVLYFLFTGTLPFEAENYLALMRQHTDTPPTPVRLINPDLPVSLEKLISQCLLKNPEGRPASAKEVAERLREIKNELIKKESGEMPILEQKTMILSDTPTPITPEYTLQTKETAQGYPITPTDSQKIQYQSPSPIPSPSTPQDFRTPTGTIPSPLSSGAHIPYEVSGGTVNTTPMGMPMQLSPSASTSTPIPTNPTNIGTPYTPIPTPFPYEIAPIPSQHSNFKINFFILILLLISLISLCLSGFIVYTYYHNGALPGKGTTLTSETHQVVPKTEPVDYSRVLSNFIKEYDNNYKFEVIEEKQGNGYKAYILDFTSQSWHPEKTAPPVWRHWLTVIVPQQRVKDVGMLILTNGFSTLETPMSEIPPYFISLAVSSKSVVSVLEGFPRDNVGIYKTPTQIVHLEPAEFASWSFKQYFETHETSWIVFCPLVKSIVRAMDAVQELLLKNLRSEIPLKEFVLCSETPFFVSWLVPPVDNRVIGLVSINTTGFHLEQQIKRMFMDEVELPKFFAEIDDAGLFPLLETEDGENLLKIIDPYYYREVLKIPKLIISMNNNQWQDMIFLSEQVLSEIPEPVNWLVCPQLQLSREYAFLPQQTFYNFTTSSNTNLRVYDFKDTIQVFYQRLLGQKNMPIFQWDFSAKGDCYIRVSEEIIECRLWYCSSDRRGTLLQSQNKNWKYKILSESAEGIYRFTIPIQPQQYTAVFAEVIFPSLMGIHFPLTTDIHIIPPQKTEETNSINP
ncbi:MAG: protein kinase domain-containing protein [Candidatus Hydrogenedens sp.]